MTGLRRCWIGPVTDEALDRAVADDVLTPADADALREFRDILRDGPRRRAAAARSDDERTGPPCP